MFSKEEEAGLEEYVLTCSQMFHRRGYTAVRRLSFEYAQRRGKKYPESWAKIQDERQFNPDMIINLDETGITTVQNIPREECLLLRQCSG